MDADKPSLYIRLPRDEPGEARAQYAADFEIARARLAAHQARKIAENDALNRIQPGQAEQAKAVWQGEGGSTADDKSLPTIYPKQ